MGINLTITPQTLEQDFARIANELMNNWILAVNETFYRITEIEFYCKSILEDGPIKDPYTHGHTEQMKSGTWYFHGSGIDLTFGSIDYYGGILIRAIQRLGAEPNYINGPLNSITEILSNLDSFYAKNFRVGLMSIKEFPEDFINPLKTIKAPRVGLNHKIDVKSHKKLFRFLIMPRETNRDKSVIHQSLLDQGFTHEEADQIWK